MCKELSLFLCSLFFIAVIAPSGFAQEKWTQAEIVDSTFHVYLLIGQSNMAGRAALEDSIVKTPSNTILMLDSTNAWVPARDPLHFDKPGMTGVGPGLSFAQSMQAEYPNLKIGLIPSAWGGSPIRVWQPGKEYLNHFPYDEAVKRAQIAMQQGELKGILWHQGESDNTPRKAAEYLKNLKTLVQNLRSELDAPDLPFIAGEIGHFNKKNYINPFINRVTEEIPHSAVVSAEGLTDKGDQLHFDAISARELGRRYARKMIKLQKEMNNSPQ